MALPVNRPKEIETDVSDAGSTPSILISPASSNMCRICYSDKTGEALLSPCRCMGSIGLLHLSCLEMWLGSSNTNKCDLCHFEFETRRKAKPFSEWMTCQSAKSDHRNLLGDIFCFFLLLPLAGISTWLCITGAIRYNEWDSQWEASGLLVLTCVLIIIFVVWCFISIRYHFRVFAQWRKMNHVVKIVHIKDNNWKAKQLLKSKAIEEKIRPKEKFAKTKMDKIDSQNEPLLLGDSMELKEI
ncbi:hypothetical protein SNEBB_000249 [Seison nebaliae]|nr:hypothetical protein SNEBB_000249 [Seison nebaliae]